MHLRLLRDLAALGLTDERRYSGTGVVDL